MPLHGKNIVGSSLPGAGAETFQAINPATSRDLEPGFHNATQAELDQALELADRAFQRLEKGSGPICRNGPEGASHKSDLTPFSRPPLGIGPGSRIEGAIVDKNCHIGRNVQVVNTQGVDATGESEQGMICDGIPVIPKGATLPDGWSM